MSCMAPLECIDLLQKLCLSDNGKIQWSLKFSMNALIFK